MIFFHRGSPALAIEDVERLFAERGLHVARDGNALSVRWEDGPELFVTLSAAPHVAEEAGEIAEGTPFAAELSRCDARFEIEIEGLAEVLDEINTLIEVQLTLQDATGGYLFNAWNGELSGPENVR